MGDVPFEALMRLLRVKASSYINEFVEKLKNDSNKFVPVDGNVHPITVSALEDDEDGLLPVINEQNTQILSFYHSEIEQYINHYMRSWNPCVSTLQGVQRVIDDKNTIKNMLTVS
ncbi:hypothetical protein NECAME_13031 [Necator americanus]|uniref:Uncharacterized protein n=1 Tax=Necator americanus TaxID=51031 RepID=W2SX68_NECAM|nr:hypothetical protein NECAME_13031 [Necator americanus]ETN74344.1 hypothetical protein NECAME_13031 [Necator americanus]